MIVDSFGISTATLPSGQYIRGLMILDNDVGSGFISQGLRKGLMITRAHQLPPLDVIITEGPEDILELLANLPEKGTLILELTNPGTGATFELTVSHRSPQDRMIEQQLQMVRQAPDFPIQEVFGYRMQLLADGAFEALDRQLEEDSANVLAELGPLGQLTEAFAPGAIKKAQNRRGMQA